MTDKEKDMRRRALFTRAGGDPDDYTPEELSESFRELLMEMAREQDDPEAAAAFLSSCVKSGILEPKKGEGPLTLSAQDVNIPTSFSLTELENRPDITLRDEGRLTACTHCGGAHKLQFGEGGRSAQGEEKFTPSAVMGFICCGNPNKGGEILLVVVGSKLLPGVEFIDETKE